jgi:hypothetical protein
MGGCLGCFRKKDDLNEVNQDDILWLQTNSSLTTGIPSNLHFSIGGLSDMSGQEPAVVTARKAQEKAEREKGIAAFVTYCSSNVNSLETDRATVPKVSLFSLYAHLYFFQFCSQVRSSEEQSSNECGW